MDYKIGDIVRCLPGRRNVGSDGHLGYGGYGYHEYLVFTIKRIDNSHKNGLSVLWGNEIPNGGGVYSHSVELASKNVISYHGNVLKFRFV